MTKTPRAKKEFGQHFLVDPNIVSVIGRLARLDPGDVVLEIGPGLGVLTRLLVEHAAHVHAIEIDPSLEPALRREFESATNLDLLFADALDLDPGALDPAPNKLVANLPYNIATPLVVESAVAPGPIRSWCVMVQREVADRFFATPSTKAYGAVSVLLQLHTERTGFHPVARTVFRPPPNVDSALVAFERKASAPTGTHVRRVVQGAFAHRRKTLVNSLTLSGVVERARANAAMIALGLDPGLRAEALPPDVFVDLATALDPSVEP